MCDNGAKSYTPDFCFAKGKQPEAFAPPWCVLPGPTMLYIWCWAGSCHCWLARAVACEEVKL